MSVMRGRLLLRRIKIMGLKLVVVILNSRVSAVEGVLNVLKPMDGPDIQAEMSVITQVSVSVKQGSTVAPLEEYYKLEHMHYIPLRV